MFSEHCKGCITKDDCFNFAECLREKYDFYCLDNVEETTELTNEAIEEHKLLPIFQEGRQS